MGWERRGEGVYYYRKVRRGGRVVSEYVGQGEVAQLAALLDTGGKRDRERNRKASLKARAEEKCADEALIEFEKLAQAITRGYYITEGYHVHKGQWRRKRERGK